MIKDITIGQYFPGKSFIHSLDARAKLSITFFYIILIFFCKNFFSLGLMFAFTLICIMLSRVSVKIIFRGLRAIFIILIFTSALQIFYNKTGELIVEWWKISITTGGVFTAIFMAVRIISLLLMSSLLTYTTSPTMLTDAIERLLSPLKLIGIKGVHTLAMMMTIALRFIPTLIEEIDKIMSAQKARGADLESGGLIKRIKALIPIFIPLLVNSFRHAFELALAMESRCYHGGEGRTRMKQMHLGWRDYTAISAIILVIAGIVALNIIFEPVI